MLFNLKATSVIAITPVVVINNSGVLMLNDHPVPVIMGSAHKYGTGGQDHDPGEYQNYK